MLSSDQNVETIAQLVEAVKEYLGQRAEYARLDLTEKMARLFTGVMLTLVLFLILIVVLLFASLGLTFWLSKSMGLTAAFLTVAAVFVLILIVVYAFRRPWIERPLVRWMAKLLLS